MTYGKWLHLLPRIWERRRAFRSCAWLLFFIEVQPTEHHWEITVRRLTKSFSFFIFFPVTVANDRMMKKNKLPQDITIHGNFIFQNDGWGSCVIVTKLIFFSLTFANWERYSGLGCSYTRIQKLLDRINPIWDGVENIR